MDRHPSGTPTGARTSTRRDGEGLWDWNLVSNRIRFSPGWIALAGCQEHEIGNTPDEWFQRVHADDSQQLSHDIEAARAAPAGEFDLRYRLRHKDGTYRWMRSRGLVVRNDLGDAIRLTGSQVDVTVDTVTDPLTGLPNRLLLLDRLTQSIARARRHSSFHFALVLIDLGRPAGPRRSARPDADPLLSGAARRLETCLRLPEAMADLRQSDLVARLDGDRLAVLLDGLTVLTHATAVAERILAGLLNPFSLSGREVRLSPAIGIALSATGYAHADEALRDAETAVHRARVLGGSHCELFDADVLKTEQSVLQLEGELELALQREEFELVYQPIMSLASDTAVGFEALVRWRHPVLGTVSPLDFIPIAERTGLIVPLGQWILQEACVQLKAWHTVLGSHDLWVSVNLSGVQLKDSRLPDQIEEALRRADLPARNLVLELTESVAMDNPVAVTTLLMRLRALGIRISIDDFGTGYSSLAYLRQFPVDALKIDQSFVRGIANDTDTAAIAAGIVAMAKELGLYVVAEGVEQEAQLAVLRSMQCESAQGYLFAEPLDPRGAEAFLTAGPSLAAAPQSHTMAGDSPRRVDRVQHWYATARSRVRRESLAAAAVLGVLASAGAGTLFLGERPPEAEAAPVQSLPLTPSAETPQVTEAEKTPAPLSANRDARPPTAPTPLAKPVPTPVPTSVTTPVPTPVPPVVAKPRSTKAAPPAPASFDVVHLHRVGRCRGRLVVSPSGVEFVSDKAERSDGFTLKHGEFVHSAAKDTLTIRSADKTYRFTVAAESPQERADTQLAIVDTIVRSRDR